MARTSRKAADGAAHIRCGRHGARVRVALRGGARANARVPAISIRGAGCLQGAGVADSGAAPANPKGFLHAAIAARPPGRRRRRTLAGRHGAHWRSRRHGRGTRRLRNLCARPRSAPAGRRPCLDLETMKKRRKQRYTLEFLRRCARASLEHLRHRHFKWCRSAQNIRLVGGSASESGRRRHKKRRMSETHKRTLLSACHGSGVIHVYIWHHAACLFAIAADATSDLNHA